MTTTLSKAQLTDSTKYYDANAQNYFETTVGNDLSKIYDLFLSHLPKGAKILDAGCGSGRDSKHFLNQGYVVTAFDGSKKMVELARKLTNLPIQHNFFSQIDFKEEFDGIWTCASLLHVPKTALLDILQKLKRSLKPKGIWYMSFKHGKGEHDEGDRYFYDQTERSLSKVLEQLGGIDIIHLSVPQSPTSRRGYKFVVAVVRKAEVNDA